MRFFYVTVVSLYYQIAVVLTAPPAPHVLQECVVSMGNETW